MSKNYNKMHSENNNKKNPFPSLSLRSRGWHSQLHPPSVCDGTKETDHNEVKQFGEAAMWTQFPESNVQTKDNDRNETFSSEFTKPKVAHTVSPSTIPTVNNNQKRNKEQTHNENKNEWIRTKYNSSSGEYEKNINRYNIIDIVNKHRVTLTGDRIIEIEEKNQIKEKIEKIKEANKIYASKMNEIKKLNKENNKIRSTAKDRSIMNKINDFNNDFNNKDPKHTKKIWGFKSHQEK